MGKSWRVRAATLLLMTMVATSCTSRVPGNPTIEGAGGAGSGSTVPGEVVPSGEPTEPPVESDEDQIRAALKAFQDAYNTQDWETYRELMCPAMRERFTGTVMDLLKKIRAEQGLTIATVVGVTVDGDVGTVTFEAENEQLGRKTVTWPVEYSDGWKMCKVS